jgi:flavin-dependent dehydrogenase
VGEEVDILVVGGGPAGLLTAAHLAERHRVALIERGVLGETSKYWVTTVRRLERHGLEDCVLYRPSGMLAGTFLGGHFETRGNFAVVDDQSLMRLLVERCRGRGVLLTDRCSLLNLSWEDTRLRVQTTCGPYRPRLLVDASGGLSPIATTFRLHNLYGFYTVYGALLRNITLRTSDIVLAYIEHLGDPPPIFEIIPCGDDVAYCAVFLYSKQLKPPRDLTAVFKAHCAHSWFLSTSHNTETTMPKMGAIAIGRLRDRRLAGVIPVGEAGLVQPPLLGTAFNEVLEHCSAVCAHITHVLRDTQGVPRALSYKYPLLKRVQDGIQLMMMRALLNGNVEAFDRQVRLMSRLPSDTVYDFCSNELTWAKMLKAVVRLPFSPAASPDRTS